jgi:hypothetical protein
MNCLTKLTGPQRVVDRMCLVVYRDVKVYQRVWKLTVLRNVLLAYVDSQAQCTCTHCILTFRLCAGLEIGQIFNRLRMQFSLGQCMLHRSVEVCYTTPTKNATLLGPNMLHSWVQVCQTARSKYAS